METWKTGWSGIEFSDLGRARKGDDILSTFCSCGALYYQVLRDGDSPKFSRRLGRDAFLAHNPEVTDPKLRLVFEDGDYKNCTLSNMRRLSPQTKEERSRGIKSASDRYYKELAIKKQARIDYINNPLPKSESSIKINPLPKDTSRYTQKQTELAAVFNRSSIITEELQREIIALRKEVEVLKRYISIREAACYTFR